MRDDADSTEPDLPAVYAALSRDGCIRRLFELARDEDLGDPPRDITSELAIDEHAPFAGAIRTRETCVVAGLAALPELFDVFSARLAPTLRLRDGERASAGATLATIEGLARDALKVERAMLNLLGRLSGVATNTTRYVERMRAAGARAALYDTRKTTPGLRALEKYAVRCGGGCAHRMSLRDAALLKDNHIAGVPLRDLPAALKRLASAARRIAGVRFVEVEVDSLEQFRALLSLPAGRIDIALLDNMPTAALRQAVALRDEAGAPILLEASGGVTLENIVEIASAGVDRISAGALTREARTIDIGLDRLA